MWMPTRRPEITVAYLTTRTHHSAAEVRLTAVDDGVHRDCFVNLDAINTIPKSRLRRRVCTLSAIRMQEVKAAIVFALDLG
jgi:mRNA interferase MazF